MSRLGQILEVPRELVLGTKLNERVPKTDQRRQRAEVEEILRRFRNQPGVILADEVGMGKTFVALGVAYSIAMQKKTGPVVLMVPANLVDKWAQDLRTFCELYLEHRHAVARDRSTRKELKNREAVRYGVARHSIDLMKLLDDQAGERCHLIFLAQGAMSRSQSDKWVRLSLIAESLRRHARGNAFRLIQVRNQIHRFLGELLWAIGEERAHDWGDELWLRLLKTDPEAWKDTYNSFLRHERTMLRDDPVPKSVIRALRRIDLKPIATALEAMPLRTSERLSDRLNDARRTLLKVEKVLWNEVLAQTQWRSPLLILDEAHHLKNPATALARQLQSPDSKRDLKTGDGAMANSFDRMLFLTATPFQLGHHELVSVLKSFRGVRWDPIELGTKEAFHSSMEELGNHLTDSQRNAITLQRRWSKLRTEDLDKETDVASWWVRLSQSSREDLTHHQLAVLDSYYAVKNARDLAEKALRPWILRHNKTSLWTGTCIFRRERIEGAAIESGCMNVGISIPKGRLLPFFLAARSAVSQSKDVLGEALCSSYEAFRFTRKTRKDGLDEQDDLTPMAIDLSHSAWYLGEFDRALHGASGGSHPKIAATVKRAVDLWEAGEKVLVFAFYRNTCRALRVHISDEIERRIWLRAQSLLGASGKEVSEHQPQVLIEKIQKRFFDDEGTRGRKALDQALNKILNESLSSSQSADLDQPQRTQLIDAIRRFLRVPTTLIRCFPITEIDRLSPTDAVTRLLDFNDGLAGSWRQRAVSFISFIATSSESERNLYLEAALKTETGKIGVVDDEEGNADAHRDKLTVANVQVAMGTTKRDTRARLMRAFNTPFFPEIFVCSEVMGEGVDLQRCCRYVIHHDLAWNPSNIEQRTGRIDRLGCKAEGRESIVVYLPYLAGTADERQYRVMSDRERWFRVVMGQDEVAKLIKPESDDAIPLPETISADLSFNLGLVAS